MMNINVAGKVLYQIRTNPNPARAGCWERGASGKTVTEHSMFIALTLNPFVAMEMLPNSSLSSPADLFGPRKVLPCPPRTPGAPRRGVRGVYGLPAPPS